MRGKAAWLLLAGVGAWGQTCPTSISPTSVDAPAAVAGGDNAYRNSFRVTAAGSCAWAASGTVPWISITLGGVPGNPSTGNGIVGYAVQANRTPVTRTGQIQIGGLFFTVRQAASTCALNVSPTGSSVGAGGGTGTFTVLTTCTWAPVSEAPWITATGGGSGNGVVNFTVAANPGVTQRSGVVRIFGATYTVTQAGAPCSITIGSPGRTMGAAGGTGTVAVTAQAGCAWTAVSSDSWVTVTGGSPGSGSGTVAYSVAANAFGVARAATISIGGALFRVDQEAASCAYDVTPAALSYDAAGGTRRLEVRTACAWTAAAGAAWIRPVTAVPVTGNGSVDFRADANDSAVARNTTITIGTVAVPVSQPAPACTVTLDPRTLPVFSAAGGTARVGVTAAVNCWRAEELSDWITDLTEAKVGSNGTVSFRVLPNTTGEDRAGVVRIGPEVMAVSQSGARPAFTAASIAHGAAATGGPVAAGEVVVIYGTGMGPASLVTLALNGEGTAVSRALAGTRVLFDGAAAPMIYTSAGQVSCIVPYAVAGKRSAEVVVEYNGVPSAAVQVPVTPAAPGIFTANQTGTGQGAILNQDFAANTAETPAERGSVVQIFATGEGLVEPLPEDGVLTAAPFPRPVLPVRVLIGGREAEVLYAGAAPSLVAGVLQVNARVPAELGPGAAEVRIVVGETQSRAGVTVAVR